MFNKRTFVRLFINAEVMIGRMLLKANMWCQKASDVIANDVYNRIKKNVVEAYPEILEDEEFASRWYEIVAKYEKS